MRTTTTRVHIDASPKLVWKALTQPELVKQWQYGSDLTTDWTVGSPIRFTSQWEGNTFEQWGTVLKVREPEELRYSLFAPMPGLDDIPENYFTMIYQLTPDQDGTDLAIIQEDPREQAPLEPDGDDADNPVLTSLKAVAENLPDD